MNQKTYPNKAQSWGIFGIMLLAQLVFAPVLVLLKEPIGNELAMLVYYVLAIGGTVAILQYIRKSSQSSTKLYFGKFEFSTIVLVIFCSLGLVGGIVVPLISLIPMPDFMKDVFAGMADDKGIASFLVLVVAAPVFEEIIFRGIMLDGLLKKYSPTTAILLSSFLFGLSHLNPWQFISAMIIGIFSGWIYYNTRNLGLSIVSHAAVNMGGFIARFFVDDSVDATDMTLVETYGGVIQTVLTIGACILIAAFCYVLLKRMFSNSDNVLFVRQSEYSQVDEMNDQYQI